MLTDKQERFCKEYVIDLNGTQAAIRAGYEFKSETSGYYVYFLINPIDNRIFYIGKGKGKRKDAHLKEYENNKFCNIAKHAIISEIVKTGLIPETVIFENNLKENDAYRAERLLILELRDCGITNISNGNIDEIEKSKFLAKQSLDKITPYETWVKKRNPTELEKTYYWGVLNELSEIAKNGCVTTLKFEQ